MPAQQEGWIATAYLESGTIVRGYVACLNEAGTAYVVASSANRTAAGRRSACIALTSATFGDPSGSGFEAQYVGVVPPSISGLGDGTASSIRVSTAGLLERAAFDIADDVCGHCDADGTAYVCFPLIGLGAALATASSDPPTNSIQVAEADGTFRGLAHASGSDDGYIEHAADRTGGAATTGDSRFASEASTWARNGAHDGDIPIWKTTYFAAASGFPANDRLYVGWDGNNSHSVGTYSVLATYRISFTTSGSSAGINITGANWLPSDPNGRSVHAQPNLLVGPSSLANDRADPVNGGLGYVWVEDVATVRGGALRTTGGAFWARASDHHVMWTIGSTDYDLLDQGGGTAPVYWSGNSAKTTDTPNFHGNPGTGASDPTPNNSTAVEYPIVGAQTFTTFRVNAITIVPGEGDTSITFTVYKRASGAGAFVSLATLTYDSGESGIMTATGTYAFADGDTFSLESSATGATDGSIEFTAVFA